MVLIGPRRGLARNLHIFLWCASHLRTTTTTMVRPMHTRCAIPARTSSSLATTTSKTSPLIIITLVPRLVLLLSCASWAAAAPPMSETWESVGTYRRRMNDNLEGDLYYRPKNLPAHQCKYLSDAECQRQDEYQANMTAAAAAAIATLDTTDRRRRLLDAPNKGDFTVLVLLVRFADHVNRPVPKREHFDALFNGDVQGQSKKVNAVGSIKSWLHFNSMGRYRVTFDVQDWFTIEETEAHYSGGVSGFRGADESQDMFKSALDSVYSTYGDFSKLDSGGWGTLDHLVVIHSGYGAEFGEPEAGCVENAEKNRLWSKGYAMSLAGWNSPDFLYTVSNWAYAGAFDPLFCQYNPANIGVLAHEYLHGFNLEDLYDQDADEENIYLGGVGRFDIMSNTWGWNRNLAIPGHLSPYSRAAAGWIEPIEITTDGKYPIQAAEFSNQAYIIKKNYPAGEYLYIENRQPVKWDRDWPAGGLVIYHVDEMVKDQTTRGYPKHPNWPKEHYRVATIQADGKFHIELGYSAGDKQDFWTQNMTLKSGGTFPNTDSYQGGILKATGIEITVISRNQFIMSFTIKGLGGSNQRSRTPTVATKDVAVDDRSTGGPNRDIDSHKTGGSIAWLLSMLGAVAAMLGLLVLFL